MSARSAPPTPPPSPCSNDSTAANASQPPPPCFDARRDALPQIDLERGRGQAVVNQGIVSLNLANNFIGLQGENSIMALAAAVEVNKCLKKMNLENNRIKDETRSAIIRKFKDRVHV
jgi:hypothetical protein